MLAEASDSPILEEAEPGTTAAPPRTATGLLDLERELTCSICADILYQPLTLLDCLHTFCGSCVKAWFAWQRSSAEERLRHRHRSSPTRDTLPYTCPSCRAVVREARPNAKVTTLLDMYIHANPERDKAAQEKEEISKSYSPGDNVMPELSTSAAEQKGRVERRHDHSRDAGNSRDEEDRRLLQRVRDMSLREFEDTASRNARSRAHRRTESGSLAASAIQEQRHRHRSETGGAEERRRRERSGSRTQQQDASTAAATSATGLEHQRSLRSMIGSSEVMPPDIQEEILQIIEAGLLENMDTSTLDAEMEEVISERIAQAYRERRERQRQREQGQRLPDAHSRSHAADTHHPRNIHRRDRSRGSSQTQQQTHRTQQERSSRPPPSSAYLLGTANGTNHRHRRSSSQGAIYPSARTDNQLADSSARQSAVQSATNLTSIVMPSAQRRRRASENERQTSTTIDLVQEDGQEAASRASLDQSPARISRTHGPETSSSIYDGNPDASNNQAQARTQSQPAPPRQRSNGFDPALAPVTLSTQAAANSTATAGIAESPLDVLPDAGTYLPNITCRSCLKQSIQHDLHYNCILCANLLSEDFYALCLRCYRLGKGCLHWFGFGKRVAKNFQRYTTSPDHRTENEPPHQLAAQRYLEPGEPNPSAAERLKQGDHPSIALREAGVFCDFCGSNTNDCYWKCDECNEGEWGFCGACTSKGNHCTHPLTAYGWSDEGREAPGSVNGTLPPDESVVGRELHSSTRQQQYSGGNLYSIDVHTSCNICTKQIQHGQTFLHCPVCNKSDYDVCVPCYQQLCSTGQVKPISNGLDGWRKCEYGHRMSKLVFGQTSQSSMGVDGEAEKATQRTVIRGPVGGFSGESIELSSSRRLQALWTRIPDEGVVDELTFPRGAVLSEVKQINQDWSWGVYCGVAGLFPAGFGRML